MRIRLFGGLLCGLAAFMPLSVAAAPVLRSGESVTVGETQEVQDDFYAAGETVTISGNVNGDLYAAAGTVTVNGTVAGDAVIVGGSVRIDGTMKDDVRLVGGELTIAGAVEDDVLVIGGVVHVLSTAEIKGDLLFWGGELVMDGDVRGSLSGWAETARINGPVLGVVSVVSDQALLLGDQAHIEGAIQYASTHDLVRAPGSVVIGDITKRELVNTPRNLSSATLPLLALFFTTLAYLLLCKTKLERLMRHVVGAFGRHGLVGFGVLLCTPIAALILTASLIGLVAGATLLLVYVLALLVSVSLSGIFIGAVLSRYVDGEVAVTLKWTLLGTLAFALILYIPYIGGLVATVAALITLGGISTLVYRRIRQ